MSITLIEINDYQLTLSQQDKRICQSGYALVEQQNVTFGEPAWLQGKALPLQCFCHYWQRLGYEKINSDNEQVRHFADLAFLQLQQLIAQFPDCEKVIFIVPASYNKQQLSLLLGIAKTCQLTVVALINTALSKLFNCSHGATFTFIDIGLHQCYFSELTAGKQLELGKSHNFSDKGVANLYKFLAQWLNHKLINECRFDAFHTAQTEQALYQSLPGLLQQDQDNFNIVVSDKSIVVTVKQIREKVADFFQSFMSTLPASSQHYISQAFADLLDNVFPSSLQDFIIVDDNSLYSNIIAKFDEISGDALISDSEVRLITQLPFESAASTSVSDVDKISHILYLGHAYPLNNQPIYLSAEPKQALSVTPNPKAFLSVKLVDQHCQLQVVGQHVSYINARACINGQLLSCGDEIKSEQQDHVFTFIYVNKGR
jgi:hypothetical protein